MQDSKKTVQIAILLAAIAGIIFAIKGLTVPANTDGLKNTVGNAGTTPHDLIEASRAIAANAVHSVVRIETVRSPDPNNEDLNLFFGTSELASQGTGICVSENEVLTNYHVVANSLEVVVNADSGSGLATIIGFDALTDLALLKVDGLDLVAAEWGDSDDLVTGDFVWAIGNPFGLGRSVTLGVISAVDQPAAGSLFQEFMQTDAAVNPGCSGGPLVGLEGKVVGVNTAILGETFRGISFAIPCNTARSIMAALRANGSVSRGWLGLRLEDEPATRGASHLPKVARVVGFSTKTKATSPARMAGIEIGDYLMSFAGKPIQSSVQAVRLAAQAEPGASVQVTIGRGDNHMKLPIEVGKRP